MDAPLVRDSWPQVRDRFPQADRRLLAAEMVRCQIGAMVNDVIAETQRRIADYGIETEADVRHAPTALVGFSTALSQGEADLKRFMYANLYHHPRQLEIAATCRSIVTSLFSAYQADRNLLPEEWRKDAPQDQPAFDRHIADFIAGMTDRYAISRHRETIGAVDLPDSF